MSFDEIVNLVDKIKLHKNGKEKKLLILICHMILDRKLFIPQLIDKKDECGKRKSEEHEKLIDLREFEPPLKRRRLSFSKKITRKSKRKSKRK
jgi:hypothetical protein